MGLSGASVAMTIKRVIFGRLVSIPGAVSLLAAGPDLLISTAGDGEGLVAGHISLQALPAGDLLPTFTTCTRRR